MTSNFIITLITALGGGGLIQALISWARGRRGDEADVASRWEKLATTSLDRAERSIAGLSADLDRLNADLTQAQSRARDVLAVLEDALREMDRSGLSTADYRERLRLIA